MIIQVFLYIKYKDWIKCRDFELAKHRIESNQKNLQNKCLRNDHY